MCKGKKLTVEHHMKVPLVDLNVRIDTHERQHQRVIVWAMEHIGVFDFTKLIVVFWWSKYFKEVCANFDSFGNIFVSAI